MEIFIRDEKLRVFILDDNYNDYYSVDKVGS